MNSVAVRRLTCLCALSALSGLSGCSSTKPYSLVAQLPPLPQTHMVAAAIDVDGTRCSVRIITMDSPKPWTPTCAVISDQSGFKDFTIDGKEVKLGAVDSGLKLLSTNPPTLPPPPTSAPTAATTHAAGVATTSAPPASTAAAQATAAPVGESFPDQWVQTPYPGNMKLQGQNLGFMVTTATLSINGSSGVLDVIFKNTYNPLHLDCVVIANQRGDFTLLFNPTEAAKTTGGGNYNIQMTTEGAGISGNIWDSHGFDSWTPSLPPQWSVASNSSD